MLSRAGRAFSPLRDAAAFLFGTKHYQEGIARMPSSRLPFAAAVGVIFVPLMVSSAARAQSSGGSASTTLDLPLETRSLSRDGSSRFEGRALLASRGGALVRREAPKPVVLGKLAVVALERATIRQGRSESSRLLSAVGQGTYLAIISDLGDYYGVLMIDRTTGWIPKSAVKMIDYQMAVGEPDATPPPPAVADTPPPPVSQSDPTANLPPDLDVRQVALLREAFSYLGVPYVWAGNTRSGLDCSGFVKNVFATQGISLPRHSGDQARVGTPVAWEELRAGDRLYFDMKGAGRVSHTGIYVGNGYFIHASTNQGKVGVDSLLKPNYYKALVGARRS